MTPKERQVVVAEEVRKENIEKESMKKATGDPEAKYSGPAKGGGKWLNNPKTGALYRVEKSGSGYELKETRKGPVAAGKALKKAKVDGPTRNELMLAVKAKKVANFRVMNKEELAEVLKPGVTPSRIKAIQEGAVKRWKSGWSSKPKKDK